MRKENAKFDTKFISEAGSYLVNSDYFAFVELKDYACYVVADGIDSDEKKESAKLAVTTVITEFSDSPGMSKGKLKRFMKAAHNALLREADEIRLEASIVIMLTDYKKAIWGHAGNARLLWIKNGGIRLTTRDTSLTQRMVDQEEIALDQVSMHEERNNLYTYLGQPGRFTPVISKKRKLEDGDIFILETRGVWEAVGDAEIIDAVDGVSKAEDVCTGLEDVILSQRREVIENYTIASVFVNKIYQNPKAGKYKRLLKIFLGIVMAIMMIVLTTQVMSCRKTNKSLEKTDKYKEDGIDYLQKKQFDLAFDEFDSAYEITEDIHVSKKSKKATKIQLIKYYKKMTENLDSCMRTIETGEYKSADAMMDAAIENMELINELLPDEVDTYDDYVLNYKIYTNNMYLGTENFENAKYADAVACFEMARDSMEKINDITKRDKAQETYNKVAMKQAIIEAEKYVKKGDSKVKEVDKNPNSKLELLKSAVTNYDAAIKKYNKAAELGSIDASDNCDDVKVKRETAQDEIDKMTENDIINEATAKVDEAGALAKAGKTADAMELYNEAS